MTLLKNALIIINQNIVIIKEKIKMSLSNRIKDSSGFYGIIIIVLQIALLLLYYSGVFVKSLFIALLPTIISSGLFILRLIVFIIYFNIKHRKKNTKG